MESVVLVIHLMIALAIIAVVLLQRSEGGGLGIGGSGGMGGLASPRATADFLTRLTGILAASFMATSLILAIISGGNRAEPVGILELAGQGETQAKISVPVSEDDEDTVSAVVEATSQEAEPNDPTKPSPKRDDAPQVPVSK